jgi:hypothetical protein
MPHSLINLFLRANYRFRESTVDFVKEDDFSGCSVVRELERL